MKRQATARRPALELLEERCLLAGTWTPLANLAPGTTGTMMLLSDGTVMSQGGGSTNAWYKLTSDVAGSYLNGTWSAQAPMGTSRLYFGSNLLPSGKVMVLGGEYVNGFSAWTNTGEIYDPLANSWSPMTSFPQSQFGDDPTIVLPNGQVFAGYLSGPQTYLYTPASNSWTITGTKLRGDRSDEETWVMLPDSSILSYDVWSTIGTGVSTAQRYMPATGTWVDAGTLPVALSSSALGYELGPAFLLPDGRVFQIGANSNTAIYTPSSNSWVAGPTIPNGKGADDAPGAILPGGHVIFAADTPLFNGTTQLFEFDPLANTITQMTGLPSALTSQLTGAAYTDRMLVLPTGQVLFGTDTSSQLWIYSDTTTPNDSWRPTVAGISGPAGGVYTLTGTQLNGISEGACYGDDAEMSSNYPIVQLTDSSGNVTYARTFNWTPGVATGAASSSVQFTLPASLPQQVYSLRVVANGIASLPVNFSTIQSVSVFSSTPANGSVISTAVTSYSIYFNEPVQAATVQASDLTVNGVPATAVALDATKQTATFTYTQSPITTQGPQSMAMAANSVTGQDGTGLQFFHASFLFDAVTLGVASTSPPVGGVFTLGSNFTLDVTFNEAIDPATAGTSNLTLSAGTVISAVVQPGNTAVRYTVSGVTTEGPLQVSIPSGRVKDAFDNPGFTPFAAIYQVDINTAAFPKPLNAELPAGSLIYDTSTTGYINTANDTDNFTLNVNAGQTISVVVAPIDQGLQPTVQLLDPSGTVIASGLAAGQGLDAFVETVPAGTLGTYTVVVGSAGATVGNYSVQLTLNAAIETESLTGVSNDTFATAQDLNPSLVTLQTSMGQAHRGAVMGTTDYLDYYSFSVNAGQMVSLALASPYSANLTVQLIDKDGATVLATGGTGATNVSSVINKYSFSVSGTYYALVSGDFGIPYSMTLTEDAAFDTQPNGSSGTAQDLTGTGGVLGAITPSSKDWFKVTLGAGQTGLQVETSTPSDGPAQFGNTLNPHIELYDSAKNLIASGIPLADGRNESINVGGLTPGGKYFIKVTGENGTTGEYFLGLTAGQGAPADIVMASFQSNGNATLTLIYQVTGAAVGSFRTGVYTSADNAFDPSDTLLTFVSLTNQSQLTVGQHTLTLGVGTGAGQVALPGAGLALPAKSYYLLAQANDDGFATEATTANDTAAFAGSYHIAGGDVVVHDSDGTDIATGAAVDNNVVITLNEVSTAYASTDVSSIDWYPHGGNDSIAAGGGIGEPMRFFAGAGQETLSGGGATSTLIATDQSNAWVLTGANAGTLNGTTFGKIGSLVGGALDDTFSFRPGSSVNGPLDGGGGTNTLDFSAFAAGVAVNLATQTATAVHGWANASAVVGGTASNTLTAGNGANTWSLTGANGGNVNGFRFSAFQNLNGGTGADAYQFAAGSSVGGKIDGKAGANTLDYSAFGSPVTVNLLTKTATALGTWANIQSVTGTGTADTLMGAKTTNTWTLVGLNAGKVNGTFTFVGFANVSGGPGTDIFKFANAAVVTGMIDGQGGTNTLDYSAYTTGIYVNLLTLSATGTGGIANIRNVNGGKGNDILVGDGYANVFKESAGANLLIGGGGKDTLSAGSGGDILIGGFTAYDSNLAALDALLATWVRPDLSYNDRVAALQAGVAYTDGTGTHTAALDAADVFDDAASDTLKGGNGLDWFFAHLSGTNVDATNNKQAGEIVTPV